MIKLRNGGVVREVETQHEADYYEKLGYVIVSSDTAEKAPEGTEEKPTDPGEDDDEKEDDPEVAAGNTPDGAEEKPTDPSKKAESSGKKGTTKEG